MDADRDRLPALHGRPADPAPAGRGAAPRLRASWRRSQGYGVPPDEVIPVFTGSPDTGSLLYECAHRVLSDLQSTIANEPVSLMVADSEGLVLARLGDDPGIRRSLDRVHLAPGFTYSERNAGTNGLGLSLADRAPSLVQAGDHYCADLRGYTCAAAPVLEPITGELAGSINLTTWSDSSSELLLGLAQTAASATSALMLVRAGGRTVRPAPRGEVFSVVRGSVAADDGDPCVSAGWRAAVG
ncbi:GAF domain-containing protein, partial [Geodermatophilus maliterrae]